MGPMGEKINKGLQGAIDSGAIDTGAQHSAPKSGTFDSGVVSGGFKALSGARPAVVRRAIAPMVRPS